MEVNWDDILEGQIENDIMDWSEENGKTVPEVNLGSVFQHSFACFFCYWSSFLSTKKIIK